MLPSSGTHLARVRRMAGESLADRVADLEAKVGGKTIEEQFREQAELIDKLFIYRFDEMDKRWDAKLDAKLGKLETKFDAKLRTLENFLEARLEEELETKLEAKFETKLEPIRNDLGAIKDAVRIILTRYVAAAERPLSLQSSVSGGRAPADRQPCDAKAVPLQAGRVRAPSVPAGGRRHRLPRRGVPIRGPAPAEAVKLATYER